MKHALIFRCTHPAIQRSLFFYIKPGSAGKHSREWQAGEWVSGDSSWLQRGGEERDVAGMQSSAHFPAFCTLQLPWISFSRDEGRRGKPRLYASTVAA